MLKQVLDVFYYTRLLFFVRRLRFVFLKTWWHTYVAQRTGAVHKERRSVYRPHEAQLPPIIIRPRETPANRVPSWSEASDSASASVREDRHFAHIVGLSVRFKFILAAMTGKLFHLRLLDAAKDYGDDVALVSQFS